MSTYNGKPYSNPKNITLKQGLLRFEKTHASNPFGDLTYGLYVDGSGNLIYRTLTTSVTLGSTGTGSSAPSLDAIYAGDQSLAISAGSLTLAGSHASNDVIVVTNASGTGDCIQITNSGSGNDIEGTSDTWHFSAAGDFTANKGVMAGDAGSDSLTLTAGDAVISDGSFTLTDADDAASFTITNNTATTASVAVFAGSGVFTGNTTSSWMTITPSGLTTGTAVYLPVAALTTGKAVQVVGNALTSGALVTVSSSAAAITNTTGGLLAITHTGATGGTNAVLVGIQSSATDETKLLELVSSATLLAGAVVSISASAMTTGKGISMIDLDSLTTGIGIHIASSATAIATTGRLLYVNHTGATGTSAVLSEFISSATDETTIVKITSAAMIDGINLHIVGTTGMTTGSLIRATTSTAGTVATNGIVSIRATGAYTSTANAGLVDIQASALVGTGTVVNIKATNASQLTNTLVNIEQTTTTTGYTGNIVAITGTSTTGAANVVKVTSANTTAGNAVSVTSGVTTTNGRGILLVANALTTGVGFGFAHTTSVIADGGSMVRLSSSSVDTGGATNGTILDIANTGSVAGTLVKIYSNLAAQTTTCLLDIAAAGYTTGFTGSLVKMTGVSTTGAGSVLTVTGANTTAGNTVKIDAAGVTTGTGLLVTSAGVIITTGELVSLVANGATTSTGVLRFSATSLTDGWMEALTGGGANFTANGGMINLDMGAATVGTGIKLTSTGIYTGTTGLIDINAVETTTGTVIDIVNTGRTTGDVIKISTNTTGTGNYIHCYDGAATDFSVSRYGAVTIAGNAIGTAALTMNNGDLVVTSGNLILTGGHIKNTPQAIVNANTAISIATFGTTIANDGASTHTLADGTVGQLKYIVSTVYTDDAVITPSNFVGTTITLNKAGDSWLGVFVGTEWVTLALGGTAAVA